MAKPKEPQIPGSLGGALARPEDGGLEVTTLLGDIRQGLEEDRKYRRQTAMVIKSMGGPDPDNPEPEPITIAICEEARNWAEGMWRSGQRNYWPLVGLSIQGM